MKRISRLVACGLVAGSTLFANAGGASAQEEGRLSNLLIQALSASAEGNCPPALMGPMLRGACQQQMPRMGQVIAQMGAIQNVEFFGMQQTPMGPVEVYRVNHANGSMMWMINTGPDGKIVVLWTPGS